MHARNDRIAHNLARTATTGALGEIVALHRICNPRTDCVLDGFTDTDLNTLTARRCVIYLSELHERAYAEDRHRDALKQAASGAAKSLEIGHLAD